MNAQSLMIRMNEEVSALFDRIERDLRIDRLDATDLRFLLCEHTIFSKQNVVFLEQAHRRTAAVAPLADELKRNLDEELGHDEAHGEHHYMLYTRSLRDEAGVDVTGYRPTSNTCAFMGRMLELSTAARLETICGSIFASETVAVPELDLMRRVAAAYAERAAGRAPSDMPRLMHFYDMHLSGVEQAHRDGLAEFLRDHARYGLDLGVLSRGFEAALTGMATWWSGLATDLRENRMAAA